MSDQILTVIGFFIAAAVIVYWLWPTGRLHRGGIIHPVREGGIMARLSKPVHDDLDDAYHLSHNECPDCHAGESLLQGPSGGMCINTACEWCLSEFNIAHFPDGPRVIDRMGKLGVQRARLYGITPEEHAEAAARIAK